MTTTSTRAKRGDFAVLVRDDPDGALRAEIVRVASVSLVDRLHGVAPAPSAPLIRIHGVQRVLILPPGVSPDDAVRAARDHRWPGGQGFMPFASAKAAARALGLAGTR